jgi:hypothetical protein
MSQKRTDFLFVITRIPFVCEEANDMHNIDIIYTIRILSIIHLMGATFSYARHASFLKGQNIVNVVVKSLAIRFDHSGSEAMARYTSFLDNF